MEIYPVVLSRAFAGLSFREASERMYLRHSIILFALAVADGNTSGTASATDANFSAATNSTGPRNVIINPTLRVLRGLEIAYVMAKDAFTAELVSADAEWLYERNAAGEFEWDRSWDLVPLEGIEEDDEGGSFAGKLVQKVKGAVQYLTTKAKVGGGSGSKTVADAPAVDSPTVASAGMKLEVGSPVADKVIVEETEIAGGAESEEKKVEGPSSPPVSYLSPGSDDFDEHGQTRGYDAASTISRNELVFMGKRGTEEELSVMNPELAMVPPPEVGDVDGKKMAEVEEQEAKPVKAPNPFVSMFSSNNSSSSAAKVSGGSSGAKTGSPGSAGVPLPTSPTSTTKPVGVSNATVSSVSSLSAAVPPEFKEHLIICSHSPQRFPGNLAYIVAPVRKRFPTMAIVILAPCPPDDEELAMVKAYGLVFYVKGSPLVRGDLRKAGGEFAIKAIILGNPTQDSAQRPTADSAALLSVLNIEAMARNRIFINMEFLHPENMKLVGSGEDFTSKVDLRGQSLNPAYVGGHIFSQSMLHTLLVQTYYNPHLLIILKQLIFRTGRSSSSSSSGPSNNVAFGGHVRKASNPVNNQSLDGHDNLFRVKIPRKYYGQRYALLSVRLMRDHNAIAIGLYRRAEEKLGSLPAIAGITNKVDGIANDVPDSSDIRYVVANPAQDTRLRKGDHVFLLAEVQPNF
ncbi:hypothetical protein HDU76_003727 [Blyttiomyces sp. JEL0837]|nr:hypothetical protein HDU76_003727 [Blyttiomyces sp. JEL0837]